MKHLKAVLKSVEHWLILLLVTDLFFIFLTWLIRPDAFGVIAVIILIFTILIFLVGYLLNRRKGSKQMNALQSFLNNPADNTKQELLSVTEEIWYPVIKSMAVLMKEKSSAINDVQLELQNYQEFIEAWTHEIKTPLSLATLILENHKDEMSPYVYSRMEHVRHSISDDVENILYYARLQADHVDYQFERMNLSNCVRDVIVDFSKIADEKKIEVQMNLLPLQVVSDKRVLYFVLSQLLSNAFKYTASEHGIVSIAIWQENNKNAEIHLAVRDNGKGVLPEDAPFIFDKGFTGNHPDRQKATGMGLYLVKKFSEALSLEVRLEPTSVSGHGFGMELIFPCVLKTETTQNSNYTTYGT